MVMPISTSTPASSAQFKCAHCDTTSEKMQRCSRCQFAHYCNRECQRAHWPQHKLQCNNPHDNKKIDGITGRLFSLSYKMNIKASSPLPPEIINMIIKKGEKILLRNCEEAFAKKGVSVFFS